MSTLHRVLPTRRRHSTSRRSLPAEITALRDLATAVQEIHLYLAGPYGPPAAPPAATTGPMLLPWQPPHLAISTAVASTTPPWLPWPSQPLAGPAAAVASLQQPAPPPPSFPWPSQPRGPVAEPAAFFPAGMLPAAAAATNAAAAAAVLTDAVPAVRQGNARQLPSPPTPQQAPPAASPPAVWERPRDTTPPGALPPVRFLRRRGPISATCAAVRLQAAARGLLVRRHVREMRDLQLQLLQVALRCATDLDLVRCVGDLGRAVSPTGGGHAVFPAGSNLKVRAIDSHPAGRRHGVTDRSAPRSTTAFRRRAPHGLLLSRWFPWDPGGCTVTHMQ
ncbi:hypothetical protein QYE76_058413 [Lolium multiflorum]|uniref:Uncharacterized protein n=1 Tax=Lolium multiflorum TaxID=4521 RepID=A0AAD8WPN6_LOLMU|nr:hypothetical protein QYE76_058413 [Lolium multiflorum]